MPPQYTTSIEDTWLIGAVVRGELPWAALRESGIDVVFEDGAKLRERNPHRITAPIAGTDIALGFLHFWSNPDELRRWASALLLGSFAGLEDAFPDGDRDPLHEGLFAAMMGRPVPLEVYAAASHLAGATA